VVRQFALRLLHAGLGGLPEVGRNVDDERQRLLVGRAGAQGEGQGNGGGNASQIETFHLYPPYGSPGRCRPHGPPRPIVRLFKLRHESTRATCARRARRAARRIVLDVSILVSSLTNYPPLLWNPCPSRPPSPIRCRKAASCRRIGCRRSCPICCARSAWVSWPRCWRRPTSGRSSTPPSPPSTPSPASTSASWRRASRATR